MFILRYHTAMNNGSVSDLKEKGCVSISYPEELRVSVEEAMEKWKAFCALPESQRAKFPYNPGAGMGVGYELKKTPGATLDVKEDMHLTLGSREWLTAAAKASESEVAEEFVGCAEDLIIAMEPLITEFAIAIEQKFGLEGFAKNITDNRNQWFIRFLHYFGNREEGDEIATPHVDKSAFTLHLYESDEGLQRLDYDFAWQDMPVSSGETVIIPGMRLQYRSESTIKATAHRVVANTNTAKTGRFSAVCFIHPKNTPVYDKQKAGRLQEFEPGFNYSMPFDEFSQLFTEERA